jgi:hypothetical protein
LAVFGGPVSTFDISWEVQHGHDFVDDRLVIFNNNGNGGNADILEYQYDIGSSSATLVNTYSGGRSSAAFGDVQRLSNGNTLVTYSTSGAIHEVDASNNLLREINVGEAIGYAQHRRTLYGPPPPFAD